jgi:hypothetical protein
MLVKETYGTLKKGLEAVPIDQLAQEMSAPHSG